MVDITPLLLVGQLEVAVEALASGNAALVDVSAAQASGNAGISLALAEQGALASGNAALVNAATALASGNAGIVDASTALASGNAALTDVSGKYDKTGGPYRHSNDSIIDWRSCRSRCSQRHGYS